MALYDAMLTTAKIHNITTTAYSRQTSDSQNSFNGWRNSRMKFSCFSKLFILLLQTSH